LEALLSARESLWLSYKSRDQKDDKPLTPSVVLAELMDYLQLSSNDIQYFKQHPLQPFNKAYFSEQSSISSFNHDWLAVHTDPIDPTNLSALDSDKNASERVNDNQANVAQDVLIEDLVRFYQHTSKYFLNNVLNVNLTLWAEEHDDEEPFALDGLTGFQLKQSILEKVLVGENPSPVSVADGHLAFGEIGQRQWQKIESSLQPLLKQAEKYLDQDDGPLPPFEMRVNLASQGVQLLGWQKQVMGDHLVMILPNKLKAKIVVPLMIQMAVLSAMGERYKGVLICQDHMVVMEPMDRSLAKEYLVTLVDHFIQGQQAPLEFMSETAWELSRPAKQGGKAYNNEGNGEKIFWGTDGPFGFAGERDDIHHRRCIADLDTIPQKTIEIAREVFGPWVELMEVIEHES